jgi:hypothetical protein
MILMAYGSDAVRYNVTLAVRVSWISKELFRVLSIDIHLNFESRNIFIAIDVVV